MLPAVGHVQEDILMDHISEERVRHILPSAGEITALVDVLFWNNSCEFI